MCFDTTARPPRPPITGHLAGTERLTLEADDGNRIAGRLATTTQIDAPGMVVLPDVRGLHVYYELLAEELAQAGVHALAIDFYGRTAGPEYRSDDFDFSPHRAAITDEDVRADVRAAIARLRQFDASRIYVMGFCFGGRAAFLQASRPVGGVIGFYGWPTRREPGGVSPLDEARAGLVKVPVLAIYGGGDQNIRQRDVDAYRSSLEAANVPNETIVYPRAPHGFFDRKMSEHSDACSDAWQRLLGFVGVGQ